MIILSDELELKCPECGKELEYLGKTGKLKHYYCKDCKREYDIYEKEKSNNPKIKEGKIIEGKYDSYEKGD